MDDPGPVTGNPKLSSTCVREVIRRVEHLLGVMEHDGRIEIAVDVRDGIVVAVRARLTEGRW